jgi:hypothetical protein
MNQETREQMTGRRVVPKDVRQLFGRRLGPSNGWLPSLPELKPHAIVRRRGAKLMAR